MGWERCITVFLRLMYIVRMYLAVVDQLLKVKFQKFRKDKESVNEFIRFDNKMA